ncbi:MAG: TIGR02391 family protein [Proteobacteria bacterium]|nr:TIGR02391 family protein [Pseudomonadota bacterium]
MQLAQLESLLKKIRQIQAIMVDVSTGRSLIQEKEDEYIVIYLDIAADIESLAKDGLPLSHRNSFHTLWDWYGYWSSKLPSYATRKKYVQELYAPLVNPIESALQEHRVNKTPVEDLSRDLAKRIETQSDVFLKGFRMRFDRLHPKIAQRCYIPFEAGEFDDAIFEAMNVVEEEVRVKISADPMETGGVLISKAMNHRAPILAFSKVTAEQEAVHSLYRGAIGSFKSAVGLRFMDNTDPVDTFECLALGSLLMRMLDRVT